MLNVHMKIGSRMMVRTRAERLLEMLVRLKEKTERLGLRFQQVALKAVQAEQGLMVDADALTGQAREDAHLHRFWVQLEAKRRVEQDLNACGVLQEEQRLLDGLRVAVQDYARERNISVQSAARLLGTRCCTLMVDVKTGSADLSF